MSKNLKKQELIDKIKYLYETDRGDFKRKTALYLNRFTEEQKSEELQTKLKHLKHYILYKESANEDQLESIESLRHILLEKLKKM